MPGRWRSSRVRRSRARRWRLTPRITRVSASSGSVRSPRRAAPSTSCSIASRPGTSRSRPRWHRARRRRRPVTSTPRSASTNGSPCRRPPSPTTCCRGSAARRSRLETGRRPPRPTCASTTSSRSPRERRWQGRSSTGCRIRSSTPATSSISAARSSCSGRGATPRRARRSRICSSVAEGDDKELVDLRVAECDFQLKRYASARDGVLPYLERASRKAEARFFHLSSLRELGDHAEFIAQTAALVADFPDSSWAEEALNNLGTHYIVTDDDALAARTFKELYDKFPTGTRSERAAWKYGWWSYTNGDYPETVRVFESAALAFPRSDYRPSFLYWAARSHARLGAATQAEARLRLVHADYANSYYGRLADRQLARRGGVPAAGIRLASRAESPAPARDADSDRQPDPAAARQRLVRRCARRAALRAARVGQLDPDRRDHRLDVPPDGRAAPGHHVDAARLSPASDGRRRAAAGGDPPGHLSADVLGVDPQAVGAARARSVPDRRPHRAGVHLRSADPSPWRMPGD